MTASEEASAQPLTAADYEDAAALLEINLQGLVRNENVEPHWIGDTGRFWYRRDGDEGPEFLVVNPDGRRSPAFDHVAVARALTVALGNNAPGRGLPASLSHVHLNDALTELAARIDDKSLTCDLITFQCVATATPTPTPELLPSPDRRSVAFTRDHNLFVRDVASHAERQLTIDGAPRCSWAKVPDSATTTIPRKKTGQPTAPFEVSWSPESRFLIAPLIDERSLALHPIVESVPTDGSRRPIVHALRASLVGDRDALEVDYFLFDLETGRRHAIVLPGEYRASTSGGFVLGWSLSRGQLFVLGHTVGLKSVGVFRLDLVTGVITTVFEQCAQTRVELNTCLYSRPNIQLLGDGAEIIWYSDRSSWGHLYLYDAQSGALKNAITAGEWLVLDIELVDEARRDIYFTGLGRERGRDPYLRHLYRTSLDGNADVVLLTEPDADHLFPSRVTPNMERLFGIPSRAPLVAPQANVFVDTWSRVDRPPVSALRSARDGRLIAELERADAAKLFATGWVAPRRECVKAADGTTDLYAVYFSPQRTRAGRQHPVIDAAYAGPQMVVAPRNFTQAYLSSNPLGEHALARLGFAVVTVDARGTPMRSASFRDAGYVEFTRVAIEDHVAAIRELAGRHPEMDLDRVGVYGWSWGGTFAAQALLQRPDFYKVGVSGAGVYDYSALSPGFEDMTGTPAYDDGTRYRTRHDEVPANWDTLDVTRQAERLQGHLLIAYAEMDENVPGHQALRLVDALTRANKEYDLLCLTNRDHYTGIVDGYLIKRTWDYFIEHLRSEPVVADIKVSIRSKTA